MKKVILLLTLVFLATNLFGQSFSYPVYQRIDNGIMKTTQTYSFVANNKQYILSYDDKIIETRDSTIRYIYLFRKDADGWKIACDKPIDIDYRIITKPFDTKSYYYPYVYYNVVRDSIVNGKLVCKLFNYRKYLDGTIIYNEKEKHDYVKVYSDGTAIIRILKDYYAPTTRESVDNWILVELVPIDNENYKVVRHD
jgi:hypothetical protein